MSSFIQRVKAFSKACQFAAWSWPVAHLPSYRLRHFYLRRILAYSIAPSASIHTGCHVTGFQLSIGPHSVINRDCRLDARGGLVIGANVSVSTQSYLITSGHAVNSPSFEGLAGKNSIEIEDYVWLGTRVIVLPGVRIGRSAVVGAGAVVTRDVEPYTIVAGNPARKIGHRDCEPSYTLNWRPWFNTDIS